MTLPEKGWRGYGRPGFQPFGLHVRVLDPRCAFPNPAGLQRIEACDRHAAQKLEVFGISRALTDYLELIGRKFK